MPTVAIESLESRVLMADMVATLSAQVFLDVAPIKASIAASVKAAAKDQHTLAVALRHTGSANATLLKTLGKDYKAALANLHVMQKLATSIGLPDTKHVVTAVESTVGRTLTAKKLAKINAAMAKLSKDDNLFVSTSVVNNFYATTQAPVDDLTTIGTSNPTNAPLNAALPAVQTDANNLSDIVKVQFSTLVSDVSAFATFILNNVSGTAF